MLWGVVASLVFPILTKVDRAVLTCTFGVISALVAAMWARRSARLGARPEAAPDGQA
jgi:hypothetical protein